MIEIKDLTFSYAGEDSSNKIENLNLNINPGECVLLCGPSGCGKTTITKTINGLIPHFDEGQLQGHTLIDGLNVSLTPLYQLSNYVGSVFQNPKSQFFNIDSDSELAFGLENNGVDPEIIKSRLDQVVKDLKIEHLLHRNVFSMSGGEKQMLAFASVYAMSPDIYVLDEPSANLDKKATEALRDQLKIIKKQGKTVVIAEHRLYYLKDIVDRVLYINKGVLQKEYSKEEFLSLTEDERHNLGLRTVDDQENQIKESPDKEGLLEVKNLSVKIKKNKILENVSFSASPGKILGIFGHNGAGKSTLLRTLAGLQKESGGKILYNGKTLNSKERNKLSYMIMQDVNHQLFGESVYEECLLSCNNDLSKEEISKVLDDFCLLEFIDKHPMALSGGQKQRLAIVTGVLAGKKVIMFDEPTSGLDYEQMKNVSEILKKLSTNGHLVIVVTHDLELLNSTCDQVLTF